MRTHSAIPTALLVLLNTSVVQAERSNPCKAAEAIDKVQADKNIEYVKSEQFLIDFKKATRTPAGTFYGTRERRLGEKRMLIVGYTKQGIKKITTILDGSDLLSFKNVLDGSDRPLDRGRFLNQDYTEMVFEADVPEKGVHIDGFTTRVSPTRTVTTKILKKTNTEGPPLVIQEVADFINAAQFRAGIKTMCESPESPSQ